MMGEYGVLCETCVASRGGLTEDEAFAWAVHHMDQPFVINIPHRPYVVKRYRRPGQVSGETVEKLIEAARGTMSNAYVPLGAAIEIAGGTVSATLDWRDRLEAVELMTRPGEGQCKNVNVIHAIVMGWLSQSGRDDHE